MWQTIYIFFPGPGSNPHVTHSPLMPFGTVPQSFPFHIFDLKKKNNQFIICWMTLIWLLWCFLMIALCISGMPQSSCISFSTRQGTGHVMPSFLFAGETDWYLVKQCHHFLVISKYGGGDTLRSCKYPIPHHNFTYCISIQIIFAYHDYYYDLVKWRFSNFVTPSGLISWHSTMKISLLSNLIIYLSICNEW